MSNDKLAEALREPAEKFAQALEKDADRMGGEWKTVLIAAARCIRSLLQAHAAEAAQPKPDDFDPRDSFTVHTDTTTLQRNAAEAAQAQSGDMMTFVHRVLEHFPIDANGYFLPLSANRLAFAIEKSHAAAPRQAADPVAWLIEYDRNPATAIATTSIAVVDGLRGNRNRITPLYTHPQSAQDAKDAARYRFAQTHDGFAVCRWDEAAGPERDGEYIPIDDEDVDAAMAKESGQ